MKRVRKGTPFSHTLKKGEDFKMGNQQNMNDQLRVRREKMQELRAEGIDPFGHRFERDSMNQDLHDKYGEMDKDELNGLEITATIAGRMVAKRGKGKVLLIYKTALAECNFISVKMKWVKICIISSNAQIWVIS